MYFVCLIRYLTFAKVQIISSGLNFPYFLAKRISIDGKRTFSGLIVRVAVGAIALGIATMMLSIAVLKGFKGEVTAKQRGFFRSEEHTSELQSLMRKSYAVFCLKTKTIYYALTYLKKISTADTPTQHTTATTCTTTRY